VFGVQEIRGFSYLPMYVIFLPTMSVTTQPPHPKDPLEGLLTKHRDYLVNLAQAGFELSGRGAVVIRDKYPDGVEFFYVPMDSPAPDYLPEWDEEVSLLVSAYAPGNEIVYLVIFGNGEHRSFTRTFMIN
jgi:hypothetical protein